MQGVEPERCPSFATAMKMGTPVFTPTLPSLADGLTVPTVGCNALATAGNFFTKQKYTIFSWNQNTLTDFVWFDEKNYFNSGNGN